MIGVPSNDFGGQEPNSEGEILGFCKGAYNVSFPLASKRRSLVPGASLLSLGRRYSLALELRRNGTSTNISSVATVNW